MNKFELLDQLNELKLRYQAYSSTKEKEQIETLIQMIGPIEDTTLVEAEYSELKEKLDYRKYRTNDIKKSLSDNQRKAIKDWWGKDVTVE